MMNFLSKLTPLPEVSPLQGDNALRCAVLTNAPSDHLSSLVLSTESDHSEMKQEQYRAIVFADICDSTGLFERYGDLKARNIIARTLTLLSQIVQQYRGQVVKMIGDEVMCTFPDSVAAILAASDMQRGVTDSAQLKEHKIALRVGLHYGKVLLENNDVFGDTVNVAARVANLAGARQIVATRATAGDASETGTAKVRDLGKARFRGKLEAIEIVELIWQKNDAGMTATNPVLRAADVGESSYLRLSQKNRTITANLMLLGSPIRIGRGQDNDLIVNHDMVSRNHAFVECRKDYFVFVDRSTNGSYLKIDDGQEYHIHRSEIPLRGSGVISLGQNAADKDSSLLLHYECLSG